MYMLGKSISLVLCTSTLAHGYTSFNPNCSNPEHSVNFVGSPDTRGTLDILWSSLFTIIACTWTILHLNVPEQRECRDPGWRGDIKWMIKGFWKKLKWMLMTMLAPELMLSLASGTLIHAKTEERKIKELVEQDGIPWSLTHSIFADSKDT